MSQQEVFKLLRVGSGRVMKSIKSHASGPVKMFSDLADWVRSGQKF